MMRALTLSIAVCVLLSVSPGARAQTSIRVEFTAAGECAVTTGGPSGRANVRYPRRTPELRCVVPSPREPGEVDLEVVLPPGAARPSGEFPRLAWSERDGRWVGAARLPAPPGFVRVPDADAGRRARTLDLLVIAGAVLGALWAVAKGRAP